MVSTWWLMCVHVLGVCAFCGAIALGYGAGSSWAADLSTSEVTPATPSVSPEPVPEPPNLIYSGAQTSVTISQTPTQTVEEASINGTLVWVKVTPRYGRPYYLIPTDGGNTFIRRDSLDTGLKVPNWVLFSW